jgi:hypothetical protein
MHKENAAPVAKDSQLNAFTLAAIGILACNLNSNSIQNAFCARQIHATEFYLVKANVERTLVHVSPNADPDGLEIVSTSVSLSGT